MTDTLLDRFLWFTVGSIFGFILGWTVQSLNSTKNAVNKLNRKLDMLNKSEKGEKGFMRHPFVADALYLLVLIIVVWSAFQAQVAANNTERIVECNRTVLNDTLISINERSTYTVDQIDANQALQEAQVKFLAVVSRQPEASQQEGRDALAAYIEALTKFTTANSKQSANLEQNPLPSKDAFKNCLEGKED